MDIAELYDQYFELCLRFARTLSYNIEEAEDICQKAFLRAMSHISLLGVLPKDKRKNWMFTVIRNIRIDELRKVQRTASMRRSYFEEIYSDDDELDSEILRWDMESHISNLPSSEQDLITSRYWLGMNSTQIGEKMDLPPSTVRYRLREALKRLKTLYERGNR